MWLLNKWLLLEVKCKKDFCSGLVAYVLVIIFNFVFLITFRVRSILGAYKLFLYHFHKHGHLYNQR